MMFEDGKFNYPIFRTRRLRSSHAIRSLVCENQVTNEDLILPIFVNANLTNKRPIVSMPGHFQLSLNDLPSEIKAISELGIKAVIIFGIPEKKDNYGSMASIYDGIVQKSIITIKETVPEMIVISDVCLCEYTDHGHCGILNNGKQVNINNDETLVFLQKQAESHAQAGVDIVAPSAMMDGMVQAIRQSLDGSGYKNLPILSYSVKYASALYQPFREAAENAPAYGDRRTYQMDIGNGNEALKEAEFDIAEGADMLLVKPGHSCLDILWRVKQANLATPVGAYHTSGEFVMIKSSAEKGYLPERQVVLEILTAMKRAGADFIITYYAREFCSW